MTRYLIDANCLIEAKNRWYGFDICPAFWQWIENQNEAGVIYSIDKIKTELVAGRDELAQWAQAKGQGFFLPTDNDVAVAYTQIVAWAQTANFKPQAIQDFMGVADGWLVAHAMVHQFTVVTHEKLDINQTTRIKIPRICNQHAIDCIDLFELLRQTQARFVL